VSPPPALSVPRLSNSSSGCGLRAVVSSARESPERREPLCEDRAGASIASGESNAARFVGAGGTGMCQIARRKWEPENKKAA
jgi:hypothetical protein